jgi:1-acyl-sn-glycerol-3-phosphate acyltransferase
MSRLRVLSRAPAILVATVSALVGLLFLRLRRDRHPRRRAVETDRLARRFARAFARRIGLRIVVEGEPPEGPVVIVANHLGYLDIVALWCVVPGVFVARADVARWPLVGIASRGLGTLFIDRARKRDLLRVIPELSAVLAEGRNAIFFPEATSSPGAFVLRFRSPLFEAPVRQGVPVVAVGLQYETPTGAPEAARAVCWWGDMSFLGHLAGLLALPHVVVRVRFSDPIMPTTDRKVLCRLAREAVVKKFIPTAPISYGTRASTGYGGARS